MDFRNSIYWNIFADVWSYFKRFYPPQNNDQYWEEATAAIGEIMTKYQGGAGERLAQGLILAILTELERLVREDNKHGAEKG